MAAGVGAVAGAEVVACPAYTHTHLPLFGTGVMTSICPWPEGNYLIGLGRTENIRELQAQSYAITFWHVELPTSELGAVLVEAAAGCSSFLAAPAGAFLGCITAVNGIKKPEVPCRLTIGVSYIMNR